MRDYSDFDIEDFAADDYFTAYVLGRDAEARMFWEQYQKNNPGQRYQIERARILVLTLKEARRENDRDSIIIESLWKNIDSQTADSERRRYPLKRYIKLGIAASVMLLVAFGIGRWASFETQLMPELGEEMTAGDGDYIEEVNRTGEKLLIHLSDGSKVTLENHSRLRYPKSFAGRSSREIILTGEAFFAIAKDPAHPFMVYTPDVVTKVLGTSFRVKAYAGDEDVVVSVTEGKVSVFSSADLKRDKRADAEVSGVVLTPNQRVTYTRSEKSFNKSLVEEPQKILVDPANRDFRFDNAPIREVFSALAEAYGVEIIYDEEVMEDCFLTVPLGNESLFEKLRIICATVNASYEVIDATVVIESKGC